MIYKQRSAAPLTIEQLEAEMEQHLARLAPYPYSEWGTGAAKFDYELFKRKQAEWLAQLSLTGQKP